MIKMAIKIVFYCFSFHCEETTVECFLMQAEKLSRSLRVKILWSIMYLNSFHSIFIKKIKNGKRRQVVRKQTQIIVVIHEKRTLVL